MQQPQRIEHHGERHAHVGGDGGPQVGVAENCEQHEHGFHSERRADVLVDDSQRAMRVSDHADDAVAGNEFLDGGDFVFGQQFRTDIVQADSFATFLATAELSLVRMTRRWMPARCMAAWASFAFGRIASPSEIRPQTCSWAAMTTRDGGGIVVNGHQTAQDIERSFCDAEQLPHRVAKDGGFVRAVEALHLIPRWGQGVSSAPSVSRDGLRS